MELASALNGSDRDMDLRSDLDSARSYTKVSQQSGSTFVKKSDKDKRYKGDYFMQKNEDDKRFKADTLSEPYDQDEKEALYGHSMTQGLFNNIRNSPLKDKMPPRL